MSCSSLFKALAAEGFVKSFKYYELKCAWKFLSINLSRNGICKMIKIKMICYVPIILKIRYNLTPGLFDFYVKDRRFLDNNHRTFLKSVE